MSLPIRTGRRIVPIARPDKSLFPCGITKADLARYYAAVAPAMLPHIAGRPLNLERYPEGIDGPRIIQQQAGRHFPSWIRRVTVPKQAGVVSHVVASDAATLVYLADQACITLHSWLSNAPSFCAASRTSSGASPLARPGPGAVRNGHRIARLPRRGSPPTPRGL